MNADHITPEWYLTRMADTIEREGFPSRAMVVDTLRVGLAEIARLRGQLIDVQSKLINANTALMIIAELAHSTEAPEHNLAAIKHHASQALKP